MCDKNFHWKNEITKIISQCFYFFIPEYCTASCGKCGTLIDKDNISAVVIILLYHDRACVVAAINRITIQPKAGNAAYHTGGEPALLCPKPLQEPIQRFPCCFIFTLTFLHQLFITFTFYYKTIIPRQCTATFLITTSSSSCLLSTCQQEQTHTKDKNPSVAKCILATGILGETERSITPTQH